MRKVFIASLLGLLFISITLTSFTQGYNIKVTIKGLEHKEIYMGHYFADKTYVKDTVKTDASGTALFKGDKTIDGGLYFIVLPSKSIAWEFLMTDDQNFSMQTDTSDYVGHLVINGSSENTLYLNYVMFMRDRNIEMNNLQEKMKAAASDKAKSTELKKEAEILQKRVKTQWTKYINENPGTFFANLINAQLFPEAPDFNISPTASNPDSIRQVRTYYYNKKHFFDNLDLSDDKLLNEIM